MIENALLNNIYSPFCILYLLVFLAASTIVRLHLRFVLIRQAHQNMCRLCGLSSSALSLLQYGQSVYTQLFVYRRLRMETEAWGQMMSLKLWLGLTAGWW